MDLTDNGRYAIGAVALLVIGFALGSLTRITFGQEIAVALLGGAAAMLLISARRGRNGESK